MADKFIRIGSIVDAFGYDDTEFPDAMELPGPVKGVAGTDPSHLAIRSDVPDVSDVVRTGDAEWIDLTDSGTTTLHSHASDITVVDGVYTVGIGGVQNGTITISGGKITAIQQAS